MPQQKIAEPMSLVHNWLEEFRRDKRAADRKTESSTAGADNTEPTTHPVMDADAQTAKANEGARAKEHDSDVKDQIGGDPIAGQRDATSASSDQPTDEMGTKKMDADEVRGNVKQPKATKDGPAENGRGDASPNHPTSQEMNSQEKYSELRKAATLILKAFANAGVKQAEEAVKKAEGEEEEGPEHEKKESPEFQAGEDEEEAEEASEEAKEAAIKNYPQDFDNGFVAAAMILQQMGMSKQAESTVSQLVDEQISSVVASARQDADDAIDYLEGFQKGASVKQAAGEMPLPPELMAGGGGMPPEGGEMPPEGGGGEMPPPEAAAGGEGAEEGGEPGGGDADEAIIQALAEAGVTPEELEQALAESGGGGEPSPEATKAAESINRKVAALVNKKRLRALFKD
jgi:hypothetical protein